MTEEKKHDATLEKASETREDTLQLVAKTLKNKRLDCAISMHDAAKTLNIRMKYLQALESGDWSPMPGDVYALGFLRQYAKYLKCNIDTSIKKLKCNDYTLSQPVTFPDPPIAPSRRWMIIFFIALIVLFIFFNVFNQQQITLLPSQMMQEQAQNIREPKFVLEHPNMMKTPSLNKEGSVLPVTPPVIDKPTTDIVKTPIHKNTTLPEEKYSMIKDAYTHTTLDKMDSKQINHRYVFTARSDDVWFQVYQQNKKDKPLYEALLKKGKHLSFVSDQILSVTCGKPKALEITMDGKIVVAVGSMSKNNQVVRHFILPRPAR